METLQDLALQAIVQQVVDQNPIVARDLLQQAFARHAGTPKLLDHDIVQVEDPEERYTTRRVYAADLPPGVRAVLDVFVAHRHLHGMTVKFHKYYGCDDDVKDDYADDAMGEIWTQLAEVFQFNTYSDVDELIVDDMESAEQAREHTLIPGTNVRVWDAELAIWAHSRMLEDWYHAHLKRQPPDAPWEMDSQLMQLFDDNGGGYVFSTDALMEDDVTKRILFDKVIGGVGETTQPDGRDGWDVPLDPAVRLTPHQNEVRRYVLWAVAALAAVTRARDYFESDEFFQNETTASVEHNSVSDPRFAAPPRLFVRVAPDEEERWAPGWMQSFVIPELC